MTQSQVLVDNSKTDWFVGDIGVRQGAVTSPIFFSIFINELIKEFQNSNAGIKIGDRIISSLFFADDIVLLATKDQLQLFLDVLSKFAHKWRLRVNLDKTKVVIFDPKCNSLSKEKFYYDHHLVQVVNKYLYLGVVFTSDLKWQGHIQHLIGKGKDKSHHLINTLLRYRNISTEAKINIWNSLVRPVLEYGSGIWWSNKLQSQTIERLQLKAFKSALGVSSKTSDVALRLELGLMRLEIRRKIVMLKWLGKISKMPNHRLVKYIYDNVKYVWGGRGRANRHTWKKKIHLILKEFSLQKDFDRIHLMTRDEWNNLVSKAALKFELDYISQVIPLDRESDDLIGSRQ